ncbi:hypothetical protein AB1Y20_021976 [Prymnesium parvum]|uniref:Endoplasmic reticulum vesicle transporter C-terminal domain-containing protein n=1 Tax=Prymnesium parvum TaxID=97485 RepID=A0AB34JHL6_PRYPA
MELRKRNVAAAPPTPVHAFVEKVRELDVYPKTLDDFKERTSSGAAISVICCSIIFLLVVSELRAYMTPTTLDQLHVDTTRSARIHINFNMTFPNMPCSGLSLVAMDVAGEQQIDVVSNINKTRYTLDGKYIDLEYDDATIAQRLGTTCGKCFPHRDDIPETKGQCCNSCNDVRSVYHLSGKKGSDGRKPKWEEHSLCQHEAVLLDPTRLKDIKEGCNIVGFLEVNKVAGNFHLAPGKAFQSATGQLVHEFKPFDTHFYNVSHVIHSLSFGEHYPNRVNPLDDAKAILSSGSGVFQYFVKVVPTTYAFASGEELSTCQYSVTDRFKSAHDPTSFVLPGVFFIYDISPIMVKVTEKRTSFTYFLTSLCAIAGGVFTTASLVDAAVYQISQSHAARLG